MRLLRKNSLCCIPVSLRSHASVQSRTPERYLLEWHHTSHPERTGRRRLATESRLARLGLEQRLLGSRSGSKIVPSIFGSLRNERISTSPVTPSTKATRSRESGKAVTDSYTPRNSMPYRRFYFRGSITFGAFSWLHRFHSPSIHRGVR